MRLRQQEERGKSFPVIVEEEDVEIPRRKDYRLRVILSRNLKKPTTKMLGFVAPVWHDVDAVEVA